MQLLNWASPTHPIDSLDSIRALFITVKVITYFFFRSNIFIFYFLQNLFTVNSKVRTIRTDYYKHTNIEEGAINIALILLQPPAQGKTQDQCVFYQDQVHGYTVFQSKLNQNWFLGITKDGSPKTARKTTSNQRATHFIEYWRIPRNTIDIT